MKEKLTSRKLWAAIVGIIFGVAIAFGVDANTIEKVAGAVTALASVITYIYTEGKIDAAAVTTISGSIQEVVECIEEEN